MQWHLQSKNFILQGECNPLQDNLTMQSLIIFSTDQQHFRLVWSKLQVINPHSTHYLLLAPVQDFHRPLGLAVKGK